MPKIILLALGFAVALDLLAGEPPTRWHPVVWMGRLIKHLEARAYGNPRLYGVLILSAMIGMAGALGSLLEVLRPYAPIVYVLVGGYLLKSTFSIRELLFAGIRIRDSLLRDDIGGARAGLPALVARDPMSLDRAHISSAVIESLAENFVDGFLSPLFYYALFGLPGALVFKAVSTLDSMIGYRDKGYADLGWASARADDLLNFIPARVGGILLALTGPGGLKALNDRNRPPSPNSGWPMSAVAGALGVWLEKPGGYELNKRGDGPGPRDINRALWRLATVDALVLIVVFIAVYLAP